MQEGLKSVLERFMPAPIVDYAVHQLIEHRIHLRIANPRKTKFGDYRPPRPGEQHRISVNKDLNPFAFTITFFHEVAHLNNWKNHANGVMPHGLEWKSAFRDLMVPVVRGRLLPNDIQLALNNYLLLPKASTCSDPNLYKALRKYDVDSDKTLVDDLPMGSVFKLSNGLILHKGIKKRTRYLCTELKTGKKYLVHGLANAIQLEL